MKKTWIAVPLVVAVTLAAGFYFRPEPAPAPGAGGRRGGGGSGPGGAGGAPVPVVAGAVESKDVPIYLDGLGAVQAFNAVTVRARVDGELQQVAFTEGQEVKKGDLLAVIDPRPFQAQVDQAAAKKAQDEAQLANAKLVLGRNEDLIKKKVLDQQSYDASKYNVDGLQATVQGDQAALENSQTQLSYTRITAPIDGRVGVRLVDQGNIVHASDAGGIVVITQLHPISVVFTLPENNLIEINKQFAAGPLRVLALDRANTRPLGEGTLAVVDNQIDPASATVKMKATFANEDLSLWPGQFVNARLQVSTRKDAIVVPASVVQRGPDGAYAYVIGPDQKVQMRPIKVASTDASVALIDDGLAAGEQVVIDGQYKLQPDSKVEVTVPGGEGKPPPSRPGGGSRRRVAATQPGKQ